MKEIQKNLTTVNYNTRGTKPDWIVIHYTGNNGDKAYGNTQYFKDTLRNASAHYFVDENEIWQCVEDYNTAWHVSAGNIWLNDARNNNSIAIEMCSKTRDSSLLSKYYIEDNTVENTIELTKYLMKKYGIPAKRVCRHFDVTGKYCPAPFVYNNGTLTWNDFKKRLEENDLTQAEVEKILNTAIAPLKSRLDTIERKQNKRYHTVSDLPEYAKKAIEYYIDTKMLVGKNNTDLDLTEDLMRMLVITYRGIEE